MAIENITQITEKLNERAKAFEEFKAANDARISAIEKNMAHAEIDSKLANIENVMKGLEADIAKLQTPQIDSKDVTNLTKFLDDVLFDRIQNSVEVGTNANGGYAVPDGLDRIVTDYIMGETVMAQLCKVAPFIANYKKNITLTPGAAEFGVESTVASKQNSPTMAQVSAVSGKLLSKQEITEEARLEMQLDPENWVKDNIGMLFSEKLESQTISGTGSDGQTKGFLAYDNASTDDTARTFGVLQYILSGGAGDLASSAPLDAFKDVIASIKKPYLRNAKWLMSRSAENAIRKVKDATNNYMWQPTIIAGEHDKLFGYDVYISDFMPAMAANSLSVAFGDFKKGLRLGLSDSTYVVRDPITAFPKVNLMFSKIYDLTLLDSRAIKLVKFASA